MEKKPELLENITMATFTPRAFRDRYPYIIRNKETGEIKIGTFIPFGDDTDRTRIRFTCFEENLEDSIVAIEIPDVDKYEFMKATVNNIKEVIYNMNDTKEESTSDEISDAESFILNRFRNSIRRNYGPQNIAYAINEHNDESKNDKNIDTIIDPDKMSRLVHNLSKFGCSLIDSVGKDNPYGSNVNSLAKCLGTVLTRTIDYNKKETIVSDNTNLDDINKLFRNPGDEISDFVSIKRFYYKRTYVKNETEDTDTISILIPNPLFMNLPYDMIKALGYKVHPMFIDKIGNVRNEICIGKTITKLGEKDLSESITMYMASGLQMLYFIEHGLKRTSPDFHGIRALYGRYFVKISDAYFDEDNYLIIDDKNTYIKACAESGFITRFKQFEDFRGALFIPENCDENNEDLCDSYYYHPFEDEDNILLLGGWYGGSYAGPFFWNYYRASSSHATADVGARLWYYM